jgi:hypothetical protein
MPLCFGLNLGISGLVLLIFNRALENDGKVVPLSVWSGIFAMLPTVYQGRDSRADGGGTDAVSVFSLF